MPAPNIRFGQIVPGSNTTTDATIPALFRVQEIIAPGGSALRSQRSGLGADRSRAA